MDSKVKQVSASANVSGAKLILVGNKGAFVQEGSITLSKDKTLYFNVETFGFGRGESINVELQGGSALAFGKGSLSNPGFGLRTPFASLMGQIGSGKIARFQYPLLNFRDNYLQIYIPGYQRGPAPIITFGAQGNNLFSPCNPCEPLRGYDGPSGL